MNTILIIDDEPAIRNLLARMMELEGYEVIQASDRASGMKLLEQKQPQLVLCDVYLPDGNGVDMVKEIKHLFPEVEVVLLTAHGNIPDGVRAIKNGASDYITKGDENSKIIPVISRVFDEMSQRKKRSADVSGASDAGAFDRIVGHSACMNDALRLARKVAATDASVLLTGETGTGKEVFARAIHRASLRSNASFVAVNCASFSKELLESELFGHKAGAFTGALKDKKGLFEEANHGSLFLDEIGEMSFELQAKLLRVLESGEYIKIGDTRPTRVDVRIISATNRNLKHEIEDGHFREDLYYRLSVFNIPIPPLRERKEDIIELANTFVTHFGQKMKKAGVCIAPESIERMRSYDWPGNVRELRNAVERAMIICESEILPGDLPLELQNETAPAGVGACDFELADMERRHITRVLQHTGGNKAETARLLKIGLTTLYRKIEEYKIHP